MPAIRRRTFGIAGLATAAVAVPALLGTSEFVGLRHSLTDESAPRMELPLLPNQQLAGTEDSPDLSQQIARTVRQARNAERQRIAEQRAAEAAEREAAAEAAAERAAAEQAAAAQANWGPVGAARSRLGGSYVTGGEGPWAFDCSGLTQYAYRQMGIELPHNTHAQWNALGTKFYAGQGTPQPGDLVFFFNGADHVGLYVGDGMMVHAANPGTGVELRSIYAPWYGERLTGFGRP